MKNSKLVTVLSIMIIILISLLNTGNLYPQACARQKIAAKWVCTDPGASCSPPAGGSCSQTSSDCECSPPPPPPKPKEKCAETWSANGNIVLPPPGGSTVMTFNLMPPAQSSYCIAELGNYVGGGILQTPPIAGSITILAQRRSAIYEMNIVDISLISSWAHGSSVNIPGLGETGINFLSYDSLTGEFDMTTGKLLAVGKGRITNNFFNLNCPLTFTTYKWGTVNLLTGDVNVDAVAFDDPPVLCEGFNEEIFPPEGWKIDSTTINYWSRNVVSSLGTGKGSAKFNFRTAPAGTIQSLIVKNLISSKPGDSLMFYHAYAPYITGTDSLIIETSFDYGVTYTTLAKLYGKAGSGTLNTAPTTSLPFLPTSTQWAKKRYSLPVGTNKIKFRVRSGAGNNLYLDSIKSGNYVRGSSSSFVYAAPEGMTSNNKLNMKDSAVIYLRNTASPYLAVDSCKTVLDSVTCGGAVTFSNAPTGTYYLVVKHRNSLETWSKAGGETYTQGSDFSYDFTSSQTQAYGNNLVQKGSRYCMYSGDVNKDGIIDAGDVLMIDNSSYSFETGYIKTDLNGDMIADGTDYLIADNNASNFISLIRP